MIYEGEFGGNGVDGKPMVYGYVLTDGDRVEILGPDRKPPERMILAIREFMRHWWMYVPKGQKAAVSRDTEAGRILDAFDRAPRVVEGITLKVRKLA